MVHSLPPTMETMVTSDGIRLDADVYWPQGGGPFPVLLQRQAYGRRIASTLCYAHPAWYAAQGFIVAVQDVRGRGTSEGEFDPFVHEARDGAEAVAWAAQLPGSNGAVGMYGFSYQGTNQLLAASLAGPELKAMAPAMIGWNLRDDWAYEGGSFNLAANLGWAIQLEAETARRAGDRERYDRLSAVPWGAPIPSGAAAWPAIARAELQQSFYARWLDRDDTAYWQSLSPGAVVEHIMARGAPALFVGGWFDSHLPGTIAGYRALADAGARLVIGPWGHFPWDRRIGAVDYGPDAVSDIDRLQVDWFRHHLCGEAWNASSPVRLFDLGAHRWRDFPCWPAPESLPLHLASTGRAAIDGTDGALLMAAPTERAEDHVVHDPWRPAPSVGGAYGTPSGPADCTQADARADVLTFTSAPLETETVIAGDITVELAVTADRPSFDIACSLSRVDPDGRAQAITTGYHARGETGEGCIAVALRPICITLASGERLRLSIAAASWPAHPVNPGDGSLPELACGADRQVITLIVANGGGAISRLLLPLAVEAE